MFFLYFTRRIRWFLSVWKLDDLKFNWFIFWNRLGRCLFKRQLRHLNRIKLLAALKLLAVLTFLLYALLGFTCHWLFLFISQMWRSRLFWLWLALRILLLTFYIFKVGGLFFFQVGGRRWAGSDEAGFSETLALTGVLESELQLGVVGVIVA